MILMQNCVTQEIHAPVHKLKSKIVFCADHIVDDVVTKQAAIAVNLVGLKLESEDILIDTLQPINFFFSEQGRVSMEMDEYPAGMVVHFIIIHCTRVKNLKEIGILAVMVEELCHYFWRIHDEHLVKYKVIEVINQMYPLIKIDDIFNMDTFD